MPAGDSKPIRVLVVDENAAVRKLLQQELSAAGYEVDTLSSATGFTEDMVAMIRPDVLLVDPLIRDVPLPVVEALLTKLREALELVVLLIDGGSDSAALRQISQACRADGQISKRYLLEAPADAVAEQLLPETEPEVDEAPAWHPRAPSAQAAADEGIDIVLDLEPLPARTLPSRPPAPRRAPSRVDLLSMIEEELAEKVAAPPPNPKAVQVEVNLFSKHNFYVGSSGDLSTGGVFVVTAHLPAMGLQVPLQLTVSPAGVVHTEAIVEWQRDTAPGDRALRGVGLSLAHLPDAQRRQLEKFFRERAPLTYLPHRT